jgi:hypothetical protein
MARTCKCGHSYNPVHRTCPECARLRVLAWCVARRLKLTPPALPPLNPGPDSPTAPAEIVYYVSGGDLTKIGTTIDLAARMTNLRAGSPVPLRLDAIVFGDRRLEKRLHLLHDTNRHHNEWFDLEAAA